MRNIAILKRLPRLLRDEVKRCVGNLTLAGADGLPASCQFNRQCWPAAQQGVRHR